MPTRANNNFRLRAYASVMSASARAPSRASYDLTPHGGTFHYQIVDVFCPLIKGKHDKYSGPPLRLVGIGKSPSYLIAALNAFDDFMSSNELRGDLQDPALGNHGPHIAMAFSGKAFDEQLHYATSADGVRDFGKPTKRLTPKNKAALRKARAENGQSIDAIIELYEKYNIKTGFMDVTRTGNGMATYLLDMAEEAAEGGHEKLIRFIKSIQLVAISCDDPYQSVGHCSGQFSTMRLQLADGAAAVYLPVAFIQGPLGPLLQRDDLPRLVPSVRYYEAENIENAPLESIDKAQQMLDRLINNMLSIYRGPAHTSAISAPGPQVGGQYFFSPPSPLPPRPKPKSNGPLGFFGTLFRKP